MISEDVPSFDLVQAGVPSSKTHQVMKILNSFDDKSVRAHEEKSRFSQCYRNDAYMQTTEE